MITSPRAGIRVNRWMALAIMIAVTTVDAAPKAELISARRIWDRAPHNAFTDLIRHKDVWYCVFREGQGHVSPDGGLRVIRSRDGKAWTSAALLTSPTADLRDPKITITPDGRLMLTGAAAVHPPADVKHQTQVWFSRDGRTWSERHPIGEPNSWLWRVTWHQDRAYGVGYRTDGTRGTRLYASRDGKTFKPHVASFFNRGYPNESSLVFLPDQTALCLLRRDGSAASAQLGRAEPPYTRWTWKDLGTRIGGPRMIRLADGRLLAAVRLHEPRAHTGLCWVDAEAGTLTEFLALPSGGDTSYPGLVVHDGLLWVSYYSSHEAKTSIYLAKVKLPAGQP